MKNNGKYLNHNTPAGSLKNKTGEWRTERPVVDKSKCINCATCESYCPEGCILKKIKNEKSKIKNIESLRDVINVNSDFFYEADLDYCKGCGICAEVCPVKCISMEKEK